MHAQPIGPRDHSGGGSAATADAAGGAGGAVGAGGGHPGCRETPALICGGIGGDGCDGGGGGSGVSGDRGKEKTKRKLKEKTTKKKKKEGTRVAHRRSNSTSSGGGGGPEGHIGAATTSGAGVKRQPLRWTSRQVYALLCGGARKKGSMRAIAAMIEVLKELNLTYSFQSRALVFIDVSALHCTANDAKLAIWFRS